MEQHARSPLLEHFITAELDEDETLAEPSAASDSCTVDNPAVSAEDHSQDGVPDVTADAEAAGPEPVDDVSSETIDADGDLPEELDTISAAALDAPAEADDAEPAPPVEVSVPTVTPASLRVTQEVGRVWVHVPSDASLASVLAALPELTLPGGVLWLSLGARPTTAQEVSQLCDAALAALERPVAGVKVYRGSLVDGLRKAADVVVELDGEAPVSTVSTESRGRQVLVIERTLRSGTLTRFRGDVLVYGDVNSGAEIEAAGNIVVLGALRGLAWAGSAGDDAAMIVSFDLRPAQLRIGRRIAFLPERPRGRGPRLPEAAVVQDGEIVLRDYRSRMG